MNTAFPELQPLLAELPPITLDEMKSIRLMKRTDQKFVTNYATLLRLLVEAKDEYFVQTINGVTVSPYATTYWDDLDDRFYRIHQTGHIPRRKVRVRTYVDAGISFLEVKNKDNHGKTRKERVSVSSPEAVITRGEGEDFLKAQTGMTFDLLTPTLANRFYRITLVNRGKTERLTIDFDLSFYNHRTDLSEKMEDAVIIELKRDGRAASPILPLLRHLRVKPLGFSKYCIGATLTNPSLRVNRFKKRIIKIRKAID